uniref:Uncharacterized protein n=1 Tax=Anopheles culicifacies TaxID=139723 RepID=A0A182MQ14_9DIPT
MKDDWNFFVLKDGAGTLRILLLIHLLLLLLSIQKHVTTGRLIGTVHERELTIGNDGRIHRRPVGEIIAIRCKFGDVVSVTASLPIDALITAAFVSVPSSNPPYNDVVVEDDDATGAVLSLSAFSSPIDELDDGEEELRFESPAPASVVGGMALVSPLSVVSATVLPSGTAFITLLSPFVSVSANPPGVLLPLAVSLSTPFRDDAEEL